MSEKFHSTTHCYAFLKTGPGNRYLKYADTWGGFYVDFEGFPLDLVAGNYEEAIATDASLSKHSKHSYFAQLKDIYLSSLPEWREKVRLAVWNRTSSCLEIWQPTGQLQPFPRKYLANLFNDCELEADLENSKEWQDITVKNYAGIAVSGPEDYKKLLDHLSGPTGYRFLPATRLCEPIASETIYAPIDTLSVLQALNRKTFVYMTGINPPGVPWPEGIFDGNIDVAEPNRVVKESGYGRFVREYLDSIVEPTAGGVLRQLSDDQRMALVCATLNPMLVETAAMLFALDIGMVIDSGSGKGRQGIDVVAVCGKQTSAEDVIRKLHVLGISLHPEATEALREHGTMSFQCKGYHDGAGLFAKRLIEFRPTFSLSQDLCGISIQQVLALARHPERSGFHHLNAWLERMCEIVVKRI